MLLIEAIELINKERDISLEKWGNQDYEPIEWLPILGEEFGEVSKEITEMYFSQNGYSFYTADKERMNRYKKEVAQLGAVCIKMLECLD